MRPPSPAQRAVQVTFVLKGHLKNAQISYLRVGALLAKVRDEKLYAALRHKSLEEYAAERLGLQHASLYHYLQVYDWAREFHPRWLAAKPKGFIPELTDAYALMWIDHHLADPNLAADKRRTLETLRAKALAGKLSLAEFRAVRSGASAETTPLRSLLSKLRGAQRQAGRVPTLPATLRAEIDHTVDEVARMLGRAKRVASRARIAARG